MHIQDFIDNELDDTELSTLVDEQFWDQYFNADKYLDLILTQADNQGIELTGVDSFDYETWAYEVYQNAEKGLS